MGVLHVRAWQNAYRGVMPDEYLDGLVVDERVPQCGETVSTGRIWLHYSWPIWQVMSSGSPRSELSVHRSIGPRLGRVVPRSTSSHRVGGSGSGECFYTMRPARWRAASTRPSFGWSRRTHGSHELYESEGWTSDGGVATEDVLGVTVQEIRYRRHIRELCRGDT